MNSVNMSMYGVGWRGRDNELLSTVNGFPFGTKQDFFDHPSLLLYYAQWTKILEFESLQKLKNSPKMNLGLEMNLGLVIKGPEIKLGHKMN